VRRGCLVTGPLIMSSGKLVRVFSGVLDGSV
jgi:hypothetical protein